MQRRRAKRIREFVATIGVRIGPILNPWYCQFGLFEAYWNRSHREKARSRLDGPQTRGRMLVP